MIVHGNIASDLNRLVSAGSNKVRYEFRLAENHGKDENRRVTWYNIVAFISDQDAELLTKGMWVTVIGEIRAEAYKAKDEAQTLKASLRITTGSVKPRAKNTSDAPEQAQYA